MALPAAVQYGQVTWTAIAGGADGADSDGLPDAIPVGGTVTFTPTAPLLLSVADPAVSVFPLPCAYSLDNTGVLRDSQGRNQISLVATDSPGITPVGWQWVAKFNITAGGQVLNRSIVPFDLPAGTVVDLTKVTPVAVSAGVPVVRGPAGPQGPIGPIGPGGSSGMVDSQGLTVLAPRDGGGAILNAYTYPTWGYGGAGPDKNPQSPTLLDLADLGVPRMLWFPGITNNYLSTPDGAAFSGNTGSTPRVITMQADIVTNEWDAIAGQSNYYLVAKPNCWLLRLTELGFPEVRAFDATGGITFTGNATVPVKQHMYIQAVLTPNDGTGLSRVDFATSPDGGVTWNQMGDSVYGPRALGAYVTTSGSSLGVLVGGNVTGSLFRGGLVSAQIIMDSTTVADVRPATWTAGGTGGSDPQGNAWTLNAPQTSNWVTQTSLAVGSGEYITLTGSPAGQQLTTPGLYSSLTLTGFRFDLSVPQALAAYRDSNTIVNLTQNPAALAASLFIDPSDGALLYRSPSGTITLIAQG